MESTGKAGAIQVTEETCHILQMFGYSFEQRGLVAVKGKGQLMTYYLIGKSDKPPTTPIPIKSELMDIDKSSPKINAPESPNPLTLSSATASPSSVRLNQNYQAPNLEHEENHESLESNNGETLDDVNKINNMQISENDPLLSPKLNLAKNNHIGSGDENSTLLDKF